MTRCDWASCTKPGEIAAGQWLFCAEHAAMDKTYAVGAPAERKPNKPRPPRPYVPKGGKRILQPCGTPGAYKRHLKHKTPICLPCAEANRLKRAEARDEARQRGVAA